MKIRIFLILTAILLLDSCSTGFLDKDHLDSLKTGYDGSENRIIYYKSEFEVSKDGKLNEYTHRVMKLSKNMSTLPQSISAYDNSIDQLKEFTARIIHEDGSSRSYGIKDLVDMALSNRNVISEDHLKLISVYKEVKPGDMIEVIEKHESNMPPLGITFSLASLGYKADNIDCIIKIPLSDDINIKVVNDHKEPVITKDELYKTYSYHWDSWSEDKNDFELIKQNREPGIMAVPTKYYLSETDSVEINNWKDFGNWYLNEIKDRIDTSGKLRDIALEITKDKKTDVEKMDAIFDYCQRNIRYEQVYLSKGGFIPNDPEEIFKRKYGDCKDYATIIYVMAKSIGLHPNLALVFRGRGRQFYDDIPVSQFNHMIAFYDNNGEKCWYDGTNRTGLARITTKDMINQKAVVIDKDNTKVVQIDECPKNKLTVYGEVSIDGNDLTGEISCRLSQQYALDMFFMKIYLSDKDLRHFLERWLRNNINSEMEIEDIQWSKIDEDFIIKTKCRIPNAVISIMDNQYLSLRRILNKITIMENPDDMKADEVFYYPYYNNVNINLDLIRPQSGDKVKMNYEYYLPPGPFDLDGAGKFIKEFRKVWDELNKKKKLEKEET